MGLWSFFGRSRLRQPLFATTYSLYPHPPKTVHWAPSLCFLLNPEVVNKQCAWSQAFGTDSMDSTKSKSTHALASVTVENQNCAILRPGSRRLFLKIPPSCCWPVCEIPWKWRITSLPSSTTSDTCYQLRNPGCATSRPQGENKADTCAVQRPHVQYTSG